MLELIDRLVETKNPTVVKAIETKIEKLEREKFALVEKASELLPNAAHSKSVLNSLCASAQVLVIYTEMGVARFAKRW